MTRRDRWHDLRAQRGIRYSALVKYRGCSPISVGSGNSKEEVIKLAKTATKFERVYVVDSITGEIVWERKKGE